MNELLEHRLNQNRRKFLSKMSLWLGGLGLGSLMVPDMFEGPNESEIISKILPHFASQRLKELFIYFKMVPLPIGSF